MGLLIIALAALMSWQSETVKKIDVDHYTAFSYSPFLNYKFQDQNTGNEMELAPTQSIINGIAIKRKGITYAAGYETVDEERRDKQKTNFFDLQISYDYKKFLYTAYYQNYQGFYINKDGALNINDQKNISSVSYGIKVDYFTDPEYSLERMLLNEKKSHESAGSWFHSLLFNITRFSNTSDLFTASSFPELEELKRFRATNLAYQYGYTKTFRYKWMHFTGLIAAGLNIHQLNINAKNNSNEVNVNANFASALDLGFFNSEKITAGVYIKQDNTSMKHHDTDITQSRVLVFGYFRYFFN